MAVSKQKDGKFLVHIDKKGLKRVRKSFSSELAAKRFESDYLAQLDSSVDRSDKRTLKELIALWFNYHGVNLSDGERRRRCLDSIADELNNPIAALFTSEMFVEYRHKKLKTLTAKTFNNHHGYLAAVFNRLFKLGVIAFDSPIAKVGFIKTQEVDMSFLTIQEVHRLMDAMTGIDRLNPHTYWVAQICIRTGARWGEAEQLRYKQIKNGRITFERTKSKKLRTIPLDDHFYNRLLNHIMELNPCPQPNQRVFSNCIGSFRRAVIRAGLSLPDGQCSHVLRHTFASHFIMNGGNILTLQKILGHADIKQTMRYAHLAPDHLQDAIKFNPLLAVKTANDRQ